VLSEVMAHYGLAQPFYDAGWFETEHHRQVARTLAWAVAHRRLIAMAGLVGSGKTAFLRRVQDDLAREGKVLISKCLSVEKDRLRLPALIAALFYDLAADREPRIPSFSERRERELRDLIRKTRRPVALFIDEAHDLHNNTLVGLKRLMEVVTDAGGSLSIVLSGHPKLKNDLQRPTMEEIGYRTTIITFEGIAGQQRPYIAWLLKACATEATSPTDIVEEAAVELLASRLTTPLQIGQYLTRALEEGFRVGERPITPQLVEAILSPQLDELEPRLRRHGYDVRAVAELAGAKTADIQALLRGELEAARAREVTDRLRAAGLPI
jgi:type II secretory pathway predicted ATPase ExeA